MNTDALITFCPEVQQLAAEVGLSAAIGRYSRVSPNAFRFQPNAAMPPVCCGTYMGHSAEHVNGVLLIGRLRCERCGREKNKGLP